MAATEHSLALVADIGGTNARFALCDLQLPAPVLRRSMSLEAAQFSSVEHAARHYLDVTGAQPRAAALAVACPVTGDEIRLTNRAWSFSREALQRQLRTDALLVLNDFGAVAWAVPELRTDERVLLQGQPRSMPQGPVTVIGPGTGLGVSLLVGDGQRGWQVVETEGGHTSFAAQDEEERAIEAWIAARVGRVSNERLLSGAGLSNIDAALRERAGAAADAPLREPAQIVAAALQGEDAGAVRALSRFCAILGSVAGDFALAHGARSVAIAGGIVPRFVDFLRASAFRERFQAKGRFAAFLDSIPVEVVTHPDPGLLGAAVALRAAIPSSAAPGAVSAGQR